MHADILIKNGKCITMNDQEILNWVAIKNDKIIGLGHNENYDQFISTDTIILDAKKNTVIPGFIDSHFHVVLTALNAASLDLSKARSFEEIGRLISDASLKYPGKHIRGIHLQHELLKEHQYPNRLILDKYCNNAPISLHSSDYQVSILNTYAMLYFKIPFTTIGVEIDEKQTPTGIFRNQANAILYLNTLKDVNDEYRKTVVSNVMNKLLSNGITTLHAMEGGRMCGGTDIDIDAEFIYRYAKEFPIDMELFYPTMNIDKIKTMSLNRIGGVIYIDGTIGGHTAALTFPYADKPESKGNIWLPQDDINEFVLNCYKNKLQLSLFTLGDRAVEAALIAHEKAIAQTGITGLRHRLEHVEISSESQMMRAHNLGIIFSMQPTYELYWGGKGKMYEQHLGTHYENTNSFKEIIDNGVIICGGSDSDVTEPNPLLGIHSVVNHPVKSHRLDVFQALRLYTYNGAFGIFQENKKGSIELGKMADIVILNEDILSIAPDKIKDVEVSTTIKSGELLYNVNN
nr:amidohydrolase [uncultured Aminipila sp.]